MFFQKVNDTKSFALRGFPSRKHDKKKITKKMNWCWSVNVYVCMKNANFVRVCMKHLHKLEKILIFGILVSYKIKATCKTTYVATYINFSI